MCGIAGFFAKTVVASAISDAMLAALKQRGPDAQHAVRWHGDGSVAAADAAAVEGLLHARLSIIDPRPIADQPMQNDDGSIWICYNGEVYDWQSDAEELKRAGVAFKTHSDTEFILRAYEHWGMAMLPKLRGMFAFVIIDRRTQKVWVARDRMGLKPLLYTHHNGEFAFASTVRALLPFVPSAHRTFSARSIDAYLAHRYVPAPATIYSSIHRLENAHALCFDLKTRSLAKHEYWRPTPAATTDWRGVLDAAISMRTVADRPLGVFLSSGIDSSLVAARLSQMGHRGLGTFTAAFDDAAMDESPLAKQIADTLGLPNRAVPIPHTIANDFERIVADLDEPFADPSAFPLWYLSRETSQHVKVVLGGDGGDELFAGYKRFAKHLRTRWRAAVRLPLPPSHALGGRGLSRLCDEASLSWQDAYSLRFSGFTPAQRRGLQPNLRGSHPTYWRGGALVQGTPLEQLLEVDRLNYLPEYILRKGDLCTMAHGLELRAPLLDHRWVETVHALHHPQRFTVPPKALLWAAAPELRSLDLLHRKKKGFNPPLDGWLRDDLKERVIGLGGRLAELTSQQLSQTAVDLLVARYQNGGESTRYLAEQVLQLTMLETSLRQLNSLNRSLPSRDAQ